MEEDKIDGTVSLTGRRERDRKCTYSVTLCCVRVMVIRLACPNSILPFHWNLVAGNIEFFIIVELSIVAMESQ